MQSLKSLLIDTKKHNVVFNIALWFLYYIVLLFIFTRGKTPLKIDYIYTASFLLFAAIPVVVNTYFLVPKFLQKGNYLIFVISLLSITIIFGQLYIYSFDWILELIFPNYFFISYQDNFQSITIIVLLVVVSMLIRIFESWLYFNANQNKILKTENQRIQSQLTNLRSQINPHFLFNSLNVIYALAIEKKEETQDAIVQLSDVLRYIIYDADAEYIQLKDEVQLLKNYISFQKYRTHGLDEITFDTSIEDETFQIYPMLLLPLVENAFKHGMQNGNSKGFVNIKIEQQKEEFIFTVENSKNEKTPKNKEEYSGVGLENVRNNLNIVYPERHEVLLQETEEIFAISLKINQK